MDIETKRWENILKIPSQAVLGRSVDELPEGIRDKPEVDKSKTMVPVVYRSVNGKAVVNFYQFPGSGTPISTSSANASKLIPDCATISA